MMKHSQIFDPEESKQRKTGCETKMTGLDWQPSVFAGVASFSELVGLRPTELLARWLEGTIAHSIGPATKKRHLIGCLQPEDGVGYVVYRLDSNGPYGDTYEFHVLEDRWTGQTWRIMLNNDLSFDGARMVVVRREPDVNK